MGLSTRRGLDQVVAQRGVLAAGAGYIPVEPDWPQDRVASIVEQSGLRVALVDDPDDARFGPDVTVLQVGTPAPLDAPTSPAAHTDARQQASDDSLAYVIFTSGSTGRPKGVAVEHRAVRTTIDELWRAQHLSADDRVLALSAFSFDLNVYDLFCVPAEGGAVVIPARDRYRDPGHWLELMAQHRVTIWNSAPALMEMLVEYAEIDPDLTRRALADLRWVMLSADWIPVTLPDRIRAWAPQAQVVSLGGATEASIWSISHQIDEVPADWPSIPYGRALAGQSFDILDGGGAPTRVGVAGELHIGGQGLAKEYLGDPAQTHLRIGQEGR